MAEQGLDLRSSAGLLRQKRRLLALVGAVGLLIGLTYAILVPARLSSSSLILLPTPASGQQGAANSEVDTQVLMVLSTTVLERAGQEMSPPLSAEDVERRLEVSAKTTQLIEIRAFDTGARQARALSQAVAETFITSIRDTAREITAATLSDLRKRSDTLDRQVNTLQSEIETALARQRVEAPNSPEGRREAQVLAQLRAEQANTSLQLDKVKDDLFNFSTLGSASRAGISIVQAASPATGPGVWQRLGTFAPLGFLLGVMGAAVALLVQARRDPRVRTRDDLADAVASTVLADVRSRPQRSVAEWSTLLTTYEVGPVEAWAYRQVLRALTPAESRGTGRKGNSRQSGRLEHPRSVTVLSLSGDERALAIAPQLAVFASSLGLVTRLVVAGDQGGAASLRAACAGERHADPRTGVLVRARPAGAAGGLPPAQRMVPTIEPSPEERSDQEPEGGSAQSVTGSNGKAGTLDEEIAKRIAAFLKKWPRPSWDKREPAPAPVESTDADPDTEPATEPDNIEPDTENATAGPEGSSAAVVEEAADLTIVVIAADRREPTLRNAPDTAVTLLAIAPGTATTAELAKLAVATDESGRRIDGIVVADPDAWDNTTGRRSLDERAMQTQLPIRLTGTGSVAPHAGQLGSVP